MALITIDHPDEVISWFASYPEPERARKPDGGCPHLGCLHRQTAVVGWGPDPAHYELLICTDDGCQGECRGWCPAPGNYTQLCAIRWKHLEPAGAVG